MNKTIIALVIACLSVSAFITEAPDADAATCFYANYNGGTFTCYRPLPNPLTAGTVSATVGLRNYLGGIMHIGFWYINISTGALTLVNPDIQVSYGTTDYVSVNPASGFGALFVPCGDSTLPVAHPDGTFSCQ